MWWELERVCGVCVVWCELEEKFVCCVWSERRVCVCV